MRRTFEVKAGEAGVVVSLTGADTALIDCAMPSAALWLPEGIHGVSDWISLSPGRYALANLNGHPDGVRLEAYFSDSLFSKQCESARSVTLSADEPTFITLANTNAALGFVRVNGHDQRFLLQTGVGVTSPSISLCSGCGSDATCSKVFPTSDLPTLPVADGAVLRIENAVTRSDWAFAFYPASETP